MNVAESVEEGTTCRLLIVSDVDFQSATFLASQFVLQTTPFDAVLICGPFNVFDDSSCDKTLEQRAAAIGNMSCILSQFETIVCRVMFLPSENDPTFAAESSSKRKRHLTPNSVDISHSLFPLSSFLFAAGLSHCGSRNSTIADESSPLTITKMLDSLSNIFQCKIAGCPFYNAILAIHSSTRKELNKVLTYMIRHDSDSCDVQLCIATTSPTENNTDKDIDTDAFSEATALSKDCPVYSYNPSTHKPEDINGITIVHPKSLSKCGQYTVVSMKYQPVSPTKTMNIGVTRTHEWTVTEASYHTVPNWPQSSVSADTDNSVNNSTTSNPTIHYFS